MCCMSRIWYVNFFHSSIITISYIYYSREDIWLGELNRRSIKNGDDLFHLEAEFDYNVISLNSRSKYYDVHRDKYVDEYLNYFWESTMNWNDNNSVVHLEVSLAEWDKRK